MFMGKGRITARLELLWDVDVIIKPEVTVLFWSQKIYHLTSCASQTDNVGS